jgi:hypothetical protein
MIDVELTPEAYALVREGVTLKSRKSVMYKVLMPEKLADQLSAMRNFSEDISDVILRLAEEAKAPASCGAVR